MSYLCHQRDVREGKNSPKAGRSDDNNIIEVIKDVIAAKIRMNLIKIIKKGHAHSTVAVKHGHKTIRSFAHAQYNKKNHRSGQSSFVYFPTKKSFLACGCVRNLICVFLTLFQNFNINLNIP